ncbi:hypothetical protein, partial [Salmonella sp. s58408]|uniref:hypothetical protein n=1 Tax=Salmonella sp. s58408 TaxID=3159701 RepID=UPI00397FFCAF
FFLYLSAFNKHTMGTAHGKQSVQEVWDRHFIAFSAQDVETLLLDYDEDSVITSYNQTSGSKKVYEGVEGARSLFTGLVTVFTHGNDLETLVADVSEEG